MPTERPRLPRSTGPGSRTVVHVSDLLAMGDSIRDDLRDELREIEARVMKAINDATFTHAQQHLAADVEQRTFVDTVEKFMKDTELAQAYRDGVLGFLRFSLTTLHRYWKGIAVVGGLALGATGHLSIGIGVP